MAQFLGHRYRAACAAPMIAFALLAAGCGGEAASPTPIPTVTPAGPSTANEAVDGVRRYLSEKMLEGGLNCLDTLEAATSVSWTATQPGDDRWAVTLKVEPARLQFRVHSWFIFTRDGRVEAPREPC